MEEEHKHEEATPVPKVTTPEKKPSVQRLTGADRRRVLKTFLTVGPTRMGKSSLVNALAGKPICVVGKSSGAQQSTTT
jgi:ribosome biogenesis GTPase A